ncbi:MAG: endonuclease VII domain-containing protein [Candidatus Thorarchaeota archaeon]|jgi:hypothetical protein
MECEHEDLKATASYRHGCRCTRCKEGAVAWQNEYRKKHPRHEYKRALDLRQKYNMTVEDYDTLLADQDGKCAICYSPPSSRRLDVDHNHSTGEVRGLLCAKCNTGIGLFDDSTVALQKAIDYLKEGR